jgi:hypothetical protein
MVKLICVGSGPHHEFDVSKFFYESQGQIMPRTCPGHRASVDFVPKTAGGGKTPVKAERKWLSMCGMRW